MPAKVRKPRPPRRPIHHGTVDIEPWILEHGVRRLYVCDCGFEAMTMIRILKHWEQVKHAKRK